VNAETLARLGGGCDGSVPRVDRRRFTVSTTPYASMTCAYGFNKNGGCSFVSYGVSRIHVAIHREMKAVPGYPLVVD